MVDIGTAITAASAAFSIGVAALATAHAQATIGAAGAGLLAEKENLAGNVLIFIAIPETIVILGFVVAFLILQSLN